MAAPNEAVLGMERAILAEVNPAPKQWVDTTRFGFHPSSGLLRFVAAAGRLQAEPPGSTAVIHGVALGGGQSVTVLRHARS